MRYVADFETSTNEWLEIDGEARVWAVAWVDIDKVNQPNYGNTLRIDNSLEKFMFEMDRLKGEHECYFHNLKYDGQYIIDYLERQKRGIFKQDDDLSEPFTYRTMITDMGIFYTITVRLSDKPDLTPKGKQKMRKGKPVYKKTVITFKDSLKKIPLKVSQIAETYGIKEQKTEINYKKYRPVGYELTEEEKEYITNDVIIVAKALDDMINHQGQKCLTISSDALSDFKHRLVGLPQATSKEKEKAEEYFRQLFPKLEKEIDDYIRKSYKGGYTYCNPKYASQMVGEGLVYDVNSLYPSCMRDNVLPYGKPIYAKGELTKSKKYPLFIQTILCTCRLKDGFLPMIQIKNSIRFNESEYLTCIDEPQFLTLTNIDLDLFLEHYDVEYEPIDGYYFKGHKGFFNNYIEYWGGIKKNPKTKGQRQLAKLMLNSLYGKFASQTKAKRKEPYYDEVKDMVRYNHFVDDEDREPVYTAMASFITAYARDKMIRSAQSCYDRFLYCDTDSLHILGLDVPNIEIHQSELGYWKCEGVFYQAKYLRAKTYAESFYINESYDIITDPKEINQESIKSNQIEVKCAGMPDSCKATVDYDNFELGSVWEHGKLGMETVKGGCVLHETSFKIKTK